MAQPTIQTSFASGEWAPKLLSRVDIQKYRAGASLLRNFYVDYSGGGASTRAGTQYIATSQALNSRLIKFQPSTSVSYVLEFGNFYIAFYSNGSQIISGGIPYTIGSPYAIADIFPNPLTGNPGIKFVQDVTSMIITHPNYAPQVLTIIAPNNWTITPIVFGSTIGTPTGVTSSTTLAVLASGWNYGYLVTAVDANGQESAPSAPTVLTGFHSLADTSAPGTNTVQWTAVNGAISYNVYKATPTYNTALPPGTPYGFIGNTTGVSFLDPTPSIAPDFGQGAPVPENPFLGSGIQSYTVTTTGTYTTVPGVTVAPPGTPGGAQATASASLGVTAATISSHGVSGVDVTVRPNGAPSPVGSLLTLANGVSLQITSAHFVSAFSGFDGWSVDTVSPYNPGSITSGSTPTNPVTALGFTYPGGALVVGPPHIQINLTWGVTQVIPISHGAGYLSAPTVTFSAGAAAATAALGSSSLGNPGVVGFIQERLVLAAQAFSVQDFNLSQPSSFFNFNTSFPVEDDDAISGNIISEDLNIIRSLVDVPTGLLALTNKGGWLLNGGGGISTMNPITPSNITAQPQAYNGASDLKPIKINMDIIYGTYKGNYVRDLAYNIYMQIFTGSDITTLSNHLFFGHAIFDWGWAEEPFKTLWAVREDGTLLSLCYVKEQELVGWAHHDTNGQFLSVCTVTETTDDGNVVDAVYFVVRRSINGQLVNFIERMDDRYFPYGYEDSWSVDAALQTAPVNTVNSTIIFTGDGSVVGNTVQLTDFNGLGVFTSGMVNWVVRVNGGIYKITSFIDVNNVNATVVRVSPVINPYTGVPYPETTTVTVGYTIWQPITSVSGLNYLANQAVTGVADGTVISGTVSNTGTFNLGGTYTKVTLGLAFTPQLRTLALDLGEPTVQSKRKKLPAMTMRVTDTLGLQVGTSFNNLVTFKDFQIGAIPTQSNGPSLVTDLFSGDGRQILDQVWQEVGQLCVQQNLPYPATILGIMPEVVVGDTPNVKGGGG